MKQKTSKKNKNPFVLNDAACCSDLNLPAAPLEFELVIKKSKCLFSLSNTLCFVGGFILLYNSFKPPSQSTRWCLTAEEEHRLLLKMLKQASGWPHWLRTLIQLSHTFVSVLVGLVGWRMTKPKAAAEIQTKALGFSAPTHKFSKWVRWLDKPVNLVYVTDWL